MTQQLALHGYKTNTAAVIYVTLPHPTDADLFVTNPTLAAGDAKVSIDGAAFANLGTLPAVTPAGGVGVKIVLSAAEMNGTNILICLKDQTAPEEWSAVTILIACTTVSFDDLVRSTTPANSLTVDASGRVDVGKWLGTAVTTDATTSLPDVHVDAIGSSTAKATSLGTAIDTSNNVVKADVTYVSGDSAAADNLEAAHDGTGYVGGSILQKVDVRQWVGTTTTLDATSSLPDVNVKSLATSTAKATALAAAVDSGNNRIDADIEAISGSTAAVANMQDDYDGTGYAGGTIPRNVDVQKISGDATAADNLESYCDGTTPAPVNVTQISGDATAADNAESAFDGTGWAFTACVMPVTTSITNSVVLNLTSAIDETPVSNSIGDYIYKAGAYVRNRVEVSGGVQTVYASDSVTPVSQRTQSATALVPV
jgi:hypothetical protein